MKHHYPPTLPEINLQYSHIIVAFFLIAILYVRVDTSFGEGFIIGERLHIEPEITVRENCSDNIYLSDENEQDDWITSILPSLETKFAFTPRVHLDLTYLGRFDYYQDADNFREDHHYGDAGLKMETSKGSALTVGAWSEDSATQPYSDTDTSKDYVIKALYGDGNLNILSSTELFANYEHRSRRYDETRYQQDDYDLDFIAVGMVNATGSLLPWLLEYRYEIQENDQDIPEPSEFIYQSVYTGFRWREGHRLTGTLRLGYLWSEYDNATAYDGWATDTSIDYAIGSFTTVRAIAERGVRESTRSSRETLDYYVYSGGGLWLTYRRLDPLRFTIFGDYENQDFKSAVATEDRREDDIVVAGLTIRYRLRTWLSFAVGYRYRQNDSTIDDLDYVENRIFGQVTLFSIRQIRDRRAQRRDADIDYFR